MPHIIIENLHLSLWHPLASLPLEPPTNHRRIKLTTKIIMHNNNNKNVAHNTLHVTHNTFYAWVALIALMAHCIVIDKENRQ